MDIIYFWVLLGDYKPNLEQTQKSLGKLACEYSKTDSLQTTEIINIRSKSSSQPYIKVYNRQELIKS
jgi:hypothetical protein